MAIASRSLTAMALLACAGAVHAAGGCEALVAQIDAKIRAADKQLRQSRFSGIHGRVHV